MEQENRLSTLRNDKKALEQKLEHDFGPEGEFIVLLGKYDPGLRIRL